MRRLALIIAALTLLTASQARAVEPVPGSSCAGLNANSFTWSGPSANGGVMNGLFCNGGTTLYTGAITFQSNGNVGIGTTTPAGLFDVTGAGRSVFNIVPSPVAFGSNVTIDLGGTTNVGGLNITNIGAGTPGLFMNGVWKVSSFDHSPTVGWTNKHAVFSVNGNAFDGTSTQSFLFNATSQPNTMTEFVIREQASQTGDIFEAQNSSNTVLMNITGTGNVGIGTTSPAAPLHVKGEVIVGMQALACSSTTAGAIRYNSSVPTIEFCNGTAWTQIPQPATSCSAPAGFSFTDLIGQALATAVASTTATITFSGCTGSYVASVSGAATAQISINGGAWTTSGAISSGQTVQVRMTTSATVSTMLTATVTVGSTSANWHVTTRSASLNVFVTQNGSVGNQIGSLSNADAICQTAAGIAGYAGTYKAIMSDDTTSAASRLTLSYPIVNAYDGSLVASSNLWAGILNTIKQPSGASPDTWTGSNEDGTIKTGYTCTNWTNNAGTGGAGAAGFTSIWLNWSNPSCTLAYPLYCLQQ